MENQLKDKVNQVNALLLAGEPYNISEDTYSHFTGYKPQYIIDAMNEVFGIGTWGFKELSNELVSTQAKEGPSSLTVAQVEVWLKDVPFQPTGYGQARVTKGDIGDARKGAQTDAIKKALSYFSIGNRAYQGLLPGKNDVAKPAEVARRPVVATRQPTVNPTKPAPTINASTHETKAEPENKRSMDTIPSCSALRKRAEAMKLVTASGAAINWATLLRYALKADIEAGKYKLSDLIAVKDELPPDVCQKIAEWLDAYAAAKNKAA